MKFQVECSQKYTKESFVLQGHFGGAERFEHKVIVSEWRPAATSLRQSEGPLRGGA
jgi:hypothetical protein